MFLPSSSLKEAGLRPGRQPQHHRGVNGKRMKRRYQNFARKEARPCQQIYLAFEKKRKRQPPNDVLAYDAPLTPV
jgi:hypothetical protein